MTNLHRIRMLLILLLATTSCMAQKQVPRTDSMSSTAAPNEQMESEGRQAFGKHGMVAAAHPLASEAGVQMLKMGGNAVDAAVATSFAISVLRPQSSGIGGGGFLLLHRADKKKTEVYDFRERAPSKATRNMYLDEKGNPKDFVYGGVTVPDASVNGHLAVGTPGLVAGLVEIHKEHGTLPLATVMAPAIELAAKGFPVYDSLAESIESRSKVLTAFPGTRKIFFPNGKALKVGDTLVQTDLAWTLKQIAAKGRDGFYKGEVAKRIIAEMKRGKGLISQKDLDNYTVKKRLPVSVDYRGYHIVSMPPPSSGGVHIVQILNILSGYDYGSLPHGSAKSVHLLAEAMRRAFADRAKYLGDPEFVDVPIAGLTSSKYAATLRSAIDETKASTSEKVRPGDPTSYESPSTTHLSVVDKWGNAVSSTQTVNYSFGSGVVAEGTGIVLNDEMDDFSKKPGVPNAYGLLGSEANAIAAEKTMLSSMSPTLVFDDEDRLYLVVGSPGGPRIITATLQTIINVIDHKMPLYKAVQAPRIHHQWYPDEIRTEEDGLDPKVIEVLKAMGHHVSVKGAIGDVQAIIKERNGWTGVSDKRSNGVPMGY